jgi:hypothetical protein
MWNKTQANTGFACGYAFVLVNRQTSRLQYIFKVTFTAQISKCHELLDAKAMTIGNWWKTTPIA